MCDDCPEFCGTPRIRRGRFFLENNMVWQSRDGRRLKVRDMETDHLRNTIMMLERKYKRFDLDPDPIYFQMISEELKRRGRVLDSVDNYLNAMVRWGG